MNKLHKRCLALFLSLILLITSFQLFIIAQADIPANALLVEDAPSYSFKEGRINPLENHNLDVELSEQDLLEPKDDLVPLIIPESIQDEENISRLVRRKMDEERATNEIVFETEDQTRISYLFPHPVKYRTEENEMRDMSTVLYAFVSETDAVPALESTSGSILTPTRIETILKECDARAIVVSDYAYGTLDNACKTFYPNKLEDGIVVWQDNLCIKMVPETDEGLNAEPGLLDEKGNEQKAVSYAGAFAPSAVLRYTPTLYGIKEELILNENVGIYNFPFRITCPGYLIIQAEDGIQILDGETGFCAGEIAPVVILDAAGNRSMGHYEIHQDEEDYILTLCVDSEYLDNAVYPVTIDPSFNVTQRDDGFIIYINEVGVYTGANAWSVSFDNYHYVGCNPLDNSVSGRILYRFPFLTSQYCPFYNAYPDQIVSFKLHMKTAGVSQGCSLYSVPYNSSSWSDGTRICDDTVYYNTVSAYSEYSTKNNDLTEITADMTEKCKLWLSYMRGFTTLSYANPSCGAMVICMMENEEGCGVYPVAAYSSSPVASYVSVEYHAKSYMGNLLINNLNSRRFMGLVSWNISTVTGMMSDLTPYVYVTGELIQGGLNRRYALHPVGYEDYCIGPDCDMFYEYDDCCDWVFSETSSGVEIINYESGEYLTENQSTHMCDVTEGPPDSSCKWRVVKYSDYREVSLASMPITELWGQKDIPQSVLPKLIRYNVDFVDANDFRLVPSDSSRASGSVNGTITGRVEKDYQNVTLKHIPTGIEKTFTFYTTISDGIYFIKNAEAETYVQIDDGDAPDYNTNNAALEGWTLDGEDYQRWAFTHLGDGLFKIVSQKSGKALSVKSGCANTSQALTQRIFSYGDTLQRWKINWTTDDRIVLRPASGEAYSTDWCMSYGSYFNNAQGVSIIQLGYVSDSNLCDEWYLTRLLPTNGYEITYDDLSWIGFPLLCNCYGYAINNQLQEPGGNDFWPKQQPGDYYNRHCGSLDHIVIHPQEESIENAVGKDFEMYNMINNTTVTFSRIGRYESCPSGTYKVALVLSSSDYHWYRQDADGLWSHKRGQTPVKRTDESGELIIDPFLADRAEYITFVAYYAVKPWNNMYVSAGYYGYYEECSVISRSDVNKTSSIKSEDVIK